MGRKKLTSNDIHHIGIVSAVFPERCTATVRLPDLDDLVTKELRVLQPFTLKNHAYFLPDPGEHVLCEFLGNGFSEGFVVGAFYDKTNPPPCKDKDRCYIEFEGGAHILVDRKERFIQIRDFDGGFIKMKGGHIFLESGGGLLDLNLRQERAEELGK